MGNLKSKLFIVILAMEASACGNLATPTPVPVNQLSSFEIEIQNQIAGTSSTRSLSDFQLPDSNDFNNIPQDPNSRLTAAKVRLGQKLFYETGLLLRNKKAIGRETVSCATCHAAQSAFQSGLRQAIGDGGMGFGIGGEARKPNPAYLLSDVDVQHLRVPSVLNTAYQSNMGWAGQMGANGVNANLQSDFTPSSNLEPNFLGLDGLETISFAAQDNHRMDLEDSLVMTSAEYQQLFDEAFPGQGITQVNAGLALGAYQRTLLTNQAPFQRFIRGEAKVMSMRELQGAGLFFGKAQCYQCHSGPALSSMTFHRLGMGDMVGPGVIQSDPSRVEHLGRGGFTQDARDFYKFKTPQLYNLAQVKFYGHGGTLHSIKEVVEYKNRAQSENSHVSPSMLDPNFRPLGLSADEVDELVEFLTVSLNDPKLMRYVPDSVPSGNCFPNNDAQSRIDLGCH